MNEHERDVILTLLSSLGTLFVAVAAWIRSSLANRKANHALKQCSFPHCGHKCDTEKPLISPGDKEAE